MLFGCGLDPGGPSYPPPAPHHFRREGTEAQSAGRTNSRKCRIPDSDLGSTLRSSDLDPKGPGRWVRAPDLMSTQGKQPSGFAAVMQMCRTL